MCRSGRDPRPRTTFIHSCASFKPTIICHTKFCTVNLFNSRWKSSSLYAAAFTRNDWPASDQMSRLYAPEPSGSWGQSYNSFPWPGDVHYKDGSFAKSQAAQWLCWLLFCFPFFFCLSWLADGALSTTLTFRLRCLPVHIMSCATTQTQIRRYKPPVIPNFPFWPQPRSCISAKKIVLKMKRRCCQVMLFFCFFSLLRFPLIVLDLRVRSGTRTLRFLISIPCKVAVLLLPTIFCMFATAGAPKLLDSPPSMCF